MGRRCRLRLFRWGGLFFDDLQTGGLAIHGGHFQNTVDERERHGDGLVRIDFNVHTTDERQKIASCDGGFVSRAGNRVIDGRRRRVDFFTRVGLIPQLNVLRVGNEDFFGGVRTVGLLGIVGDDDRVDGNVDWLRIVSRRRRLSNG